MAQDPMLNALTGASGTSTTGAATTTQSSKNILGKDDFLKIFLAQLSQQDPTAPVDSQAFIAQLAQFSSLELQQNTNSDLESLMVGQAAGEQIGVTNLVGKDVTYSSNGVTLVGDGSPAIVGATLASPAANVTAVVTDSNGKTIRTVKLGPEPAGSIQVAWDGRDDSGIPQPAGNYKVAVTATDTTGANIAVTQNLTGHVSGVSFNNGTPLLTVGASQVPLSNITEITERTTP